MGKTNIDRVAEVIFDTSQKNKEKGRGNNVNKHYVKMQLKDKLKGNQVDRAIKTMDENKMIIDNGKTLEPKYEWLEQPIRELVDELLVSSGSIYSRTIINKLGKKYIKEQNVYEVLDLMVEEKKLLKYGHTRFNIYKKYQVSHYQSDAQSTTHSITLCGEVKETAQTGGYLMCGIPENVTCPKCKELLNRQPSVIELNAGCGMYACSAIVNHGMEIHKAYGEKFVQLDKDENDEMVIETMFAENEEKAFKSMFNKMTKTYRYISQIKVKEIKSTKNV